jgi:hypothetical protein
VKLILTNFTQFFAYRQSESRWVLRIIIISYISCNVVLFGTSPNFRSHVLSPSSGSKTKRIKQQSSRAVLAICFFLIARSSYASSLNFYLFNLTGYELDGCGSIPGKGKGFFSTPQPLDQFWSLLSLLSTDYRHSLSGEQSGRGVILTTHLHLVPRSRMVEL